MNIKEWLDEVKNNNFPSKERQKELAWLYWKCSTNNLDGTNRRIQLYLEPLSTSIKSNWNIELKNDYQKDPFGWTLTTVILTNGTEIYEITNKDFTMMYQYNIYHNGEHIAGIEELNQLVDFLQKTL